ncbi:protein of unknown function [Blastococcus sp. DSM 46786]|nr:protein of unknown function [Blastococcus sp. DSM 46786]
MVVPAAPQIDVESGPSLARLRAGLGGGAPLPAGTRRRMEEGFGRSFGQVRVHTDALADDAARRLGAEAFTTGWDIGFASGRYRPQTTAGDRLLAHELAHVAQQGGSGGAVRASSPLSGPGYGAEAEADRAADAVLAGRRVRPTAGGLSLSGRILRRARGGALLERPRAGISGLRSALPGPAPVPAAVLTSTVSPAGGRLTGVVRPTGPGQVAPSVKTPDEAQVAAGPSTATGPSPATVMIAGAPAGGAEDAHGAAPGEIGRGRERPGGAPPGDQPAEPAAAVEEARSTGPGPGRTRRFGRVPGDRGAAAARAARRRLRVRAAAVQRHEGAQRRIKAARAAAEPPVTAAEAAGKRRTAQALRDVPVPPPDTAGAQQRAAAAVVAPATIEDLENFAGPAGAGDRGRMAESVAAEARAQTAGVQRTLSAVSAPPLGPAPPEPVPQPEPLAPGRTAAPDLAAATPPPVPEESLDAGEFRADAEEALGRYDVDDVTLARADEGPLRAIGDDKERLDEAVSNAAGRVRGQEAAALGGAGSRLATLESDATGGMTAVRERAQRGVGAEQDTRRRREETGAESVVARIHRIYSTAEQAVTARLATLQTDAVTRFRTEQAERIEAFATGVRTDLAAFKRRRYSGLGRVRRIRDWALSINSLEEVKALYRRHREEYTRGVDQLLAGIRSDVDRTVRECQAALATAREQMDELERNSRTTLDAEARAAIARARREFGAMEGRIAATAVATSTALEREREQAVVAMDRALEEIRAENAGLVDRIAAAIQAIAEALGRFFSLMTRVTVMGVGAFVGAAGSQAREGVERHLWDQLKEAFTQWLFMKLPALQLLLALPADWSAMLVALGTSMTTLFAEELPALLPVIGAAAMLWLAMSLLTRLIPGVGAIMAVIDAVRAAWALVQSLFSAAQAFYEFLVKVADRGNGAVAFARALAFGIVAAVDAILTFLGVDRLIRRVAGAVARPFGRMVQRVQGRYRGQRAARRREAPAGADPRARRRDDDGDEVPAAARRRAAEPRQRAEKSRAREDRDRRRREQVQRRFDTGIAAVRRGLARNQADEYVPVARHRLWLTALRLRYRFTTLELRPQAGGRWVIDARMNPRALVDDSTKIVDPDRISPLWPVGIRDPKDRGFRPSRRSGNIRLRAWELARPDAVTWMWLLRGGGSWRPENVNQVGREGEEAARRELERNKEDFIRGVEPRAANAPGFDVGGLGRLPGSSEDRLFIGEAKATRAGGRTAFGAEKFTAVTTNLGESLDEMRSTLRGQGGIAGTRAVRRMNSALRDGRVTFTIFLVNEARLWAPQRALIARRIRRHLTRYLTTTLRMSPAGARRAVRSVTIEVVDISS